GRREAERRRKMEEDGKAGKTIADQNLGCHGRNGNITLSRPEPRKEAPSPSPGPRRRSVVSFQNRLRSLDRQIRQTEDRIAFSRERLANERSEPPRTARLPRRPGANPPDERLRTPIRTLDGARTS